FTSTFSNTRFTQALPAGNSVSAGPSGGFNDVTLRFSPTDTSAQTGTVTFGGLGVTARLTLTGNSGGATATVLQVDDGREEFTFGLPQGGTMYFVNRLTPARYPATLRAVQILFPTGELAAGSALNVLTAPYSGGAGAAQISGLSFTRTSATVTS